METKAQAYQNFMKAYAKSAVGRNATEDMMPVSFRIKLKDAENYKLVAWSGWSTSAPPSSRSSS